MAADTDAPDARRAIVAVFEAWERDDAAGVAALFADDGGYESPLFTESQVGREAIEATVRGGMDEIRDLRIPIKHLAGEGDVAICEAGFSASRRAARDGSTSTSRWSSRPATGGSRGSASSSTRVR
jgi:ketosteroid isomerase-like protein